MSTDSENDSGSVMMISGDLMFSSRVKGAATDAGLGFRVGFDLPEQADAIRFVIIDLSSQSGQAVQIVEQCRQRCPNAKLIAYGPHVHAKKLQAAREAGVETVMTNGQFNSQLGTLFA